MKTIVFFCLFVCIASFSFAQKPDPAITQKLLSEYEQYCSEIGKSGGLEDMENRFKSVKEFSKLFVHSAKLYNDLSPKSDPATIDAFEYGRIMMIDFNESGLATKLDFSRLSISRYEQHADRVMYRALVSKKLNGVHKGKTPHNLDIWLEFYITEKSNKWQIHHIEKGKPHGESVAKGDPVHLTEGEDFVERIGALSMKLVYVKGGTFLMGQSDPNIGGKGVSSYEQPVHTAMVTDFWIAEHELTQAFYQAVMGKKAYQPDYASTPQKEAGQMYGPRLPARISFYEAIAFCNVLSEKSGLQPYYTLDKKRKDPENISTVDPYRYWVRANPSANGYRLPTEAEWEFAAMGGNKRSNGLYPGTSSSNFLNKHANYADATYFRQVPKRSSEWKKVKSSDSFGKLAPVKSFAPNELGLYDMGGNLSEWCWGWFQPYAPEGQVPPKGDKYGIWRVKRGGSYRSVSDKLRIKHRSGSYPAEKNIVTLRLVRAKSPLPSSQPKVNPPANELDKKPDKKNEPRKLRRKGKWKQ